MSDSSRRVSAARDTAVAGAATRCPRPLRIAVLAHVRHPVRPPFAGGIEAHSYHLARGLAARGHAVTLFAAGDSDAGVPIRPTVDVHYERHLPWARFRDTATLRWHLAGIFERACRALDGDAYDVVHNNALHPLPIEHARRHGLPMLTSLHVPPFRALRAAVDGPSVPGLRFTVTSRRQLASWWGEAPPPEAHVAHNGIDLRDWPYRPGGDGSAVWAGRITPTKGTHLAVAAARRAGIALALVGPIEDRGYYDAHVAPYLDTRIRHVGHLAGPALAERFAAASLLLFTPLWDEPFGLVAIEAMATGLPVAYVDRGAAREIVGEAGAAADSADADALARAIDAARSIAPELPRRRVAERFTIERMLARYERLYAACASETAPVTERMADASVAATDRRLRSDRVGRAAAAVTTRP